MDQQDNQSREIELPDLESWGYVLLPGSHMQSIGYGGLIVAIQEEPAAAHFIPVSIHLWLRTEKEVLWSELGLDPFPEVIEAVCPGRVILRDHKGQRIDFFTFGGTLIVDSVPGESLYGLQSPAPILPITHDVWSEADLFAFEVEGMLAKYAAKWGVDEAAFHDRLGRVDPQQLYLACLKAALATYQGSHHLDDLYHALHHALVTEKKWLQQQGQWSQNGTDLDTLLAPSP